MGGNIIAAGGRDIQKIDRLATEGLLGVSNSVAYRMEEVEKHFHSRECWRGILAPQTATAWADDTLAPFVAISGADDWGGDADDEAQVFGVDDTPFIVTNVKFDVHRIIITDVSVNTVWKLRFIWGIGTMANAIIANQFSCFMVKFDSANPQQSAGIPVDVRMPRLDAGVDKVWLQAWNATDNATIDFLVGTHEYVG